MPRLLLLVLLTTPLQQEGQRPLPDGLHAARVRGGVLELSTEEGVEVPGPVSVTSGWYFDAVGYERHLTLSAQRQARLAQAEAQAAAAEAQVAAIRAQSLAAQHAAAELELRLEKAVVRADSCAQLAASTCAAAAASTAGYSAATLFMVAGTALLLGLGLGLLYTLLERLRSAGEEKAPPHP